MTVKEALQSINAFPIPDLFIEKVGVERELNISEEYTKEISVTSNYELATADVYMWLYGQPSLGEQEISFTQLQEIKKGFLDFANRIYDKYGDAKFTGGKYGFVGDKWND
jgi:hypothetical protein